MSRLAVNVVLALTAAACKGSSGPSASPELVPVAVGGAPAQPRGSGGAIPVAPGSGGRHEGGFGGSLGSGGEVSRAVAVPAVDGAVDGQMSAGPLPDARPLASSDTATDPLPDYAKIAATKAETFTRLPGFPEGFSYRPSDGSVLLCAPNLMRVGPDRKRFRLLTIPCLGSVGLADGSTLVAGQAGLYQVLKDGQVALLAEAPAANDVSVDRAGNVYFTAGGAVHRLAPEGKHDVLTANISANGIEVDPGNQFIYVTQPGNNQIVRFVLPQGGKLLGPMELHLPGVPAADGIAFDARGNLWLALHRDRKVAIIDPVSRKELARIDVPVATTVQNLAFGGARNDVLFVVGGNYDANALLLKFEVGTAGFRTNPGAASYKPVRMLPAVAETEF